MNAEMQVLQALDAAQAAFKRMTGMEAAERARTARAALQKVIGAPWSLVTRPEEADQHGWLSQLREALQQIEREPEGGEVERLAEEGLWAANELERDMRQLLGAR
jgi:hypothetical protein